MTPAKAANSTEENVISETQPTLAQPPHPKDQTEDVDMKDADQEPPVDTERVLNDKRAALLAQLNKYELEQDDPYADAFDWVNLTTDFVKSVKQGSPDIDAIELRVNAQPSASYSLFYEIILCVKYFPQRIKKDILVDLASTFLSDNLELFKIPFISTLNMFDIDHALISFVTSIRALPQLDLGKYLLCDRDMLKFSIMRDYERKSRTLKRDLLEQKRYNLLHQSTEGYAKLTVLLSDALKSRNSHFEVKYVARATEALIGHFNLDPLRALQTVFSVASSLVYTNYRFILEYLKESPWWPTGNEADCTSLETLDKGGNSNAALILASQIQCSGKISPQLCTLASLFIKEGFISFGTLYQYLSPDDEGMTKFSEYVDERIDEEITRASANALALSGPLADEDEDGNPITASAEAEEEKKKAQDPTLNVKYQIFEQLLSDGLYYPALYCLGKYPNLAYASPSIIGLALRLFNHMVDPLRERLRPLSPSQLDRLQVPISQGNQRSTHIPKPDETISALNKSGVYFYRDWTRGLPVIKTVDELIKYANEFLSFFGAKIGEDPLLISLLSKIGMADLKSKMDTPEYEGSLNMWFDFSRKLILPASTCIQDNPIAAHDMFSLFKFFPTQKRFNMYGDFQNGTCKTNLYARLNYGKAEKSTKDILKRLTKENVRSTMRRLSKITFANPLPSFFVIISQIESYDNLTNLVVEAARYFTDYAWDVLVYVLLNRLTQRREAIQSDGINDSAWLQSLATFIGKLAKSYSAFDITPILTFSLKSIHSGSSIGLSLMRELVCQMGGIQNFSDMSLAQLKALGSSESLQRITRRVIMDTRDDSMRAGGRFIKTLATTNQLSEFFILLHSYGNRLLVDASDDGHFKLITDRSDTCTAILHTFCQLVNFFSPSVEDLYANHVVGLKALVEKYGVSVPWAFELWRQHLPADITVTIDEFDVQLGDLNVELFSQFWRLALYDIGYDSTLYERQIEHLKAENHSIEQRIKIMRSSMHDPDDVVQQEAKLKVQLLDKKRFNNEILRVIDSEKQQHSEHFHDVKDKLQISRGKWFGDDGATESQVESFVQYCVIPRVLHSGIDAVFAANFITSTIDGEDALKILKYILSDGILATLIFTLTTWESENLGLFVAEVFSYVNREGTEHELKKAAYYWINDVLGSITANIVDTNEYLSRRNTFTFLKNIIPIILIDDVGLSLTDAVQDSLATETRDDLKLASNALLGLLKSASKNWVSFDVVLKPSEEETAEINKHREPILKRRLLKSNEAKRIVKLKKEEQERIEREQREKRLIAEREADNKKRHEVYDKRLEELAKREKEAAEKKAKEPIAKEFETTEKGILGEDMDINSGSASPSMHDDQYAEIPTSDALTSEIVKQEDSPNDVVPVASSVSTDHVAVSSTIDVEVKSPISKAVSPKVSEQSEDVSSNLKLEPTTIQLEATTVKSESTPVSISQSEATGVTAETPKVEETILKTDEVLAKETPEINAEVKSKPLEEKESKRDVPSETKNGVTSPAIPVAPRFVRASGPLPDQSFVRVTSEFDEHSQKLIEMVKRSDVGGIYEELKSRDSLAQSFKRGASNKGLVRKTLVEFYRQTHKSEPELRIRLEDFELSVGFALDDYVFRGGEFPPPKSRGLSRREPLLPQDAIRRSGRAPLPSQSEILPADRGRGHSRNHLPPTPELHTRHRKENTTGVYRTPGLPTGPRNADPPSGPSSSRVSRVNSSAIPTTAPPPPPLPAHPTPAPAPRRGSSSGSIPQSAPPPPPPGRPKRSFNDSNGRHDEKRYRR